MRVMKNSRLILMILALLLFLSIPLHAAEIGKGVYVIPMHYGTFPVFTGTAEEFLKLMKDVPETKVIALKPGETVQ